MDIHCNIINPEPRKSIATDTEKLNYAVLEKLRMKLENLIKFSAT